MNVYLVIESKYMLDIDGYSVKLCWNAVIGAFSNQTKACDNIREQIEKIENDQDNENRVTTNYTIVYVRDGKKFLNTFDVKKMEVK